MTLRLLRVLWLFGVMYASYMIQFGLVPRRSSGAGSARRRGSRRAARRSTGATRGGSSAGCSGCAASSSSSGRCSGIIGGFLPRAFTRRARELQDNVPPHPFRHVERTFVASVRQAARRVLRDVRARAHRRGLARPGARGDDGRRAQGRGEDALPAHPRRHQGRHARRSRIAIKVLRRWLPERNLERVHESLVDLLRRETDYVHEAACMERMAKNFADETDILFPEVVHELHDAGHPHDDLHGRRQDHRASTSSTSRASTGRQLATRLVQSFYKQLFVDRFFHADPHPGNFLVQKGPGRRAAHRGARLRRHLRGRGRARRRDARDPPGLPRPRTASLALQGLPAHGLRRRGGEREAPRADGDDVLRASSSRSRTTARAP